MMKCYDCGATFRIEDASQWIDCHGFADGRGETCWMCPVCGGEIAEAIQCAECGSDELEIDLVGGLCKDCLQKAKEETRHDAQKCLELFPETDTIEVSDLAIKLLGEEKIQQIIEEQLIALQNFDAMEYLIANEVDFAKRFTGEE